MQEFVITQCNHLSGDRCPRPGVARMAPRQTWRGAREAPPRRPRDEAMTHRQPWRGAPSIGVPLRPAGRTSQRPSAQSTPGRVPCTRSMRYPMEAPGRGWGRDLDPIGQHRPSGGRLAQRESASFTPRRSLVRSQYRPPGQKLCGSPSSARLGAIPVAHAGLTRRGAAGLDAAPRLGG